MDLLESSESAARFSRYVDGLASVMGALGQGNRVKKFVTKG
ncbi:MAG TPA: hypothetical protein VHX61_16575 [Rhizomicrobium sp.]|jgi:hypothetical protein|nr:hypothetical protein [Rhizomicrobium sp.]